MFPFSLPRRLYYKIFPHKLREKEERERQARIAQARREKADLLLEYEELLKRKERLVKELTDEAMRLYKFRSLILSAVEEDSFKRRMGGSSAGGLFKSIRPERMLSYEEVKAKAIELEQLWFKIFKTRNELSLYGLERGVNERDRGS